MPGPKHFYTPTTAATTRSGALIVADMRMNGSCAGGTGAFIDEVASILQTPPEKMNELAGNGTCVYDISGRCGVYAKTDIQPLLNQGVAKADIALSSFHAIATGKYIGDCRLTHYSALLRKALDDAGFSDVPILTNDDTDFHNLHPGFRLSFPSALRIAYALPMIDILEELLRKIRPYELTKGSADAAFDQALDAVIDGLAAHGVTGAKHGFLKAIEIMKQVPYDRSHPRPTVLIIGEYLLNFHPGANHDIEAFLEQNGFEIIEARMSDVIQKSYFYRDMQVLEYHVTYSLHLANA